MKKIVFLLSFVVCGILAACSGGGGGSSAPRVKTQSVTIAADATTQIVTLNGIDSPIESAAAQDSWLTVTVMPYTSGAVSVKLSSTSNPNTSERRTKVAIRTTTDERMELTVIQKGKPSTPSGGNTIEDIHDDMTDQPTYAPER